MKYEKELNQALTMEWSDGGGGGEEKGVEKISIIDKTLIAIQNSKRTKNFMFCHLSLCIMLNDGIS